MAGHKRTADTHVGSKWLIVLTLAVVVAAFLGGSSYAEWRAARTHDLTSEIATNESPSILYLAAARAELRDLQRLLNTHVLLTSTGRPSSTQPLKDVRDRLRQNLQSYFALPALPAEKVLWQRIDKELTDVDVLVGQIMEATAQRRFGEAQKLLVEELPDAIDDEADAIIADIQLNASRVREVAELIEGERRTRTLWVFGLDGVSVALAVSLAVLALRTLSRQEAIVRRRQEELEGFAGRVAHDLLNPIAAAEMSLAATERGAAGNERLTGLVARGRRSLARARALVDDLFAFAQAGARPLPGASTSVAEAVEGVIEEMRASAVERGISIAVTPARLRASVGCANGVLASESAPQRDQAHGQQRAPAHRCPHRRPQRPRALRRSGHGSRAAARADRARLRSVRARHADVGAGAGPGAGHGAPPGGGAQRALRGRVAAGGGRDLLVRAAGGGAPHTAARDGRGRPFAGRSASRQLTL